MVAMMERPKNASMNFSAEENFTATRARDGAPQSRTSAEKIPPTVDATRAVSSASIGWPFCAI